MHQNIRPTIENDDIHPLFDDSIPEIHPVTSDAIIDPQHRRRVWKISLVIAGVLILAGIGVTALTDTPPGWDNYLAENRTPPKKVDDGYVPGADHNGPVIRYVAQMTRAVDCEWPENGRISQGSDIRADQEINLLGGSAQITFRNGAQVVLSGPARFTILTSTSGLLRVGKLTASVPDDVQKFTINTPTATIIDAEYNPARIAKKPPAAGESIILRAGESTTID